MPRFNERRGGDRRQDDNAFYEERGRGWYRYEDGPWSPYNGGKRSFERTHPHDERRFDPRGREYWRENEDESPREWSERDDRAHAHPAERWDDRREPDLDPWAYREHLHDPLAEEDELWGNEMGTPADQPSGRSIPRGPDWQSEPRSGETWIARDEHYRIPGGFHRDARDRDMRDQREQREYGRDRDMRDQREQREPGREMRGQHEQRGFGREMRGQHEQRGFGREMRGQHEQRELGRDTRDSRDMRDLRGYSREMRGQPGEQREYGRDMGGQRGRDQREYSRREMRGQPGEQREHGRDMGGQRGRDQREYGREMRGQRGRDQREYSREMRGQPGEHREYGRDMRGQFGEQREYGRDMRRERGRDQRAQGREMRGHEQRYVGGPVRDVRDYGRDLREHRDDYDRDAPEPPEPRDFERDVPAEYDPDRYMRGQRELGSEMRGHHHDSGERDFRRDFRRDIHEDRQDARGDRRGYTDEPGRDRGAFHGREGSISQREYSLERGDFRAEQSHELRRDRGEPWHGSETRGSDEYGRGLEQRTPEDRFRPENREWAARISGRGDRRRH